MKNKQKLEFYIAEIKKRYPNKLRLNATEMLCCINKSSSTFNRIKKANNLHLIPKFTSTECKRTGPDYSIYIFDIYDIAIFLSGDTNE
ncbi:MAG: hypothetical protein DRG78_19290 [Epsilonproteobacteria bacterium]|nr:MAG: hypothetical protein DRG78_19290 [Campylobacterota bacterium]